MKSDRKITSVFYTRGFNPPYTEGHIQIVRTVTRALLLYDVNSVILNFKYGFNESGNENDSRNLRIEQVVPTINRDDVISAKKDHAFLYSLIYETVKMPRFIHFENTIKNRDYVVNVINCFRYPRILAKKMFKAPLILHFYMPHFRGQYMLKFFGNKVDMLIASSYKVARYLERYGIAKGKISVIYPPVDTDLYKPVNQDLVRPKLGLSTGSKIILYIGSLKPSRFPIDKVLGVVEELVKEIPDTLMLIFTPRSISNIKLAKEIHQKAIRLNLADKVKIHIKNLSEKEKAEVYSVADIFLCPESGPKAAIDPPLTIIEAMASGRVVFAPRSSSASEFIADKKSGFLFEQKDYNDLARRFAEILMNKDLKKRVSHQARCVVEQKSSMLVVGAKMLGHFTALINH